MAVTGIKRKRGTEELDRAPKLKSKSKSTSSKKPTSDDSDDAEDAGAAKIVLLESQILESRKHLNNIATLISLAEGKEDEESSLLAAVALCRVFCRMMTAGDMHMSKSTPEAEQVIVKWLKARYQNYVQVLSEKYLQNEEEGKQLTALTLLLRLVKQELQSHDDKKGPETVEKLVTGLLLLPEDSSTRDEFSEKYLQVYDDIRFYTFQAIDSIFSTHQSSSSLPLLTTNTLALLSPLTNPPSTSAGIITFYGPSPPPKSRLLSPIVLQNTAQTAYLSLLRFPLSPPTRKTVLTILTTSILPWFPRPELLMDFLTDSYNEGGSVSLLALSGLFYLMRAKNLDYPSFFPKLYSLLDVDLLHSKHRSKFFRLLNVFMRSSHLPSTLVASFIKRLARLSLHAPPAAIVVIVPWAYNMFKLHPACTFLLHREGKEPGWVDPFDMEERDPMKTGALESSVWELESLRSHYHPNVATLAGVLGEQFTKRGYEVEDFLGMGYGTIIDAELAKDIKKAPVIEYEIPRYIFTSEEEGQLSTLGTLMEKVFASRDT